MPYPSNDDLPSKVKNHLPEHAQDIYRAAFNSAWKQYESAEKRRGTDSREVVAHKVAWSAVEKKYFQDENHQWILKNSES